MILSKRDNIKTYALHEYAIRIKRAYDYGQSRVICGYHYQSDVDAGRLCASVGYAAVHSSEAFQKQMAKAKKEIAKILATK